MAVVARYMIDTSAAARMRSPQVASQVAPLIESGQAATWAGLDAEALYSARTLDEYERVRDNRRLSYEYLAADDEHWKSAFDVQRVLAGQGLHRAVGVIDLLTAVLARQHGLVVVHHDHDFELISQVMDIRHRWVSVAS
ncbi:MAG: VapC toxin family PIN domain ribonuclease [Gordonia sp.]|nr:VapC toxin family PIN domain ribonuclease [Gordonia sp. (in: high G+C Gram-positive bacteria)]